MLNKQVLLIEFDKHQGEDFSETVLSQVNYIFLLRMLCLRESGG